MFFVKLQFTALTQFEELKGTILRIGVAVNCKCVSENDIIFPIFNFFEIGN